MHKQIGLAGFAIRRRDPGGLLLDLLQSEVPLLKARACKAVGELGRTDLLPQVRKLLSADDKNVRFQAAWTVALLGGEGISVLQSITESPGPFREKSLQIALRRLELSPAKVWQKKLAQQPGTLRLAIQAVGIIGDPELIPWLFPHMKVPPLARVAGEAFTMITGVDLAYHDLEGEWPEGFEAGPNEDPKDENVDMDPDENLPWPNPELVQKWWEKNKGQFQTGVRYLCGKPMNIDWLKIVLRDGFQRQRAAAALELAIRQPGTPLFNVKAPGFRQIELLGKPKGPIRGPDHAG